MMAWRRPSAWVRMMFNVPFGRICEGWASRRAWMRAPSAKSREAREGTIWMCGMREAGVVRMAQSPRRLLIR